MPSRNELKGIAAGIAGRFVSRNNDINGYWAIGVLYEALKKEELNKLAINLLTLTCSPKIELASKIIFDSNEYLLLQMQKRGLKENQILDAIIDLKYNIESTKKHKIHKYTWGDPFICSVTLTDDLNKEHVIEKFGWCGVHNPTKRKKKCKSIIII